MKLKEMAQIVISLLNVGGGVERPTCILNSGGARAGSHALRNRPVLQPFLLCLSVQHGGIRYITSPNDQH
jgi:hypothetical protein